MPASLAARNSAANSSAAAGPQMSRARSSSTVSTKCDARRSASSTLASSAIGSHVQLCSLRAMPCGSKVQDRWPVSVSRSCAVAAQASALLLVTSTAPGAARVAGTARLVVLPDRGAMTASSTSSQEATSAGPRGSSSPRATPTSLAGSAPRAGRAGRSARALAAAGAGSIGSTSTRRASERAGPPGRRRTHRRPSQATRVSSSNPTAPARARVSPGSTPGHSPAGPPARTSSTTSSGERDGAGQPRPVSVDARPAPAHNANETTAATAATPGISHATAASLPLPSRRCAVMPSTGCSCRAPRPHPRRRSAPCGTAPQGAGRPSAGTGRGQEARRPHSTPAASTRT